MKDTIIVMKYSSWGCKFVIQPLAKKKKALGVILNMVINQNNVKENMNK